MLVGVPDRRPIRASLLGTRTVHASIDEFPSTVSRRSQSTMAHLSKTAKIVTRFFTDSQDVLVSFHGGVVHVLPTMPMTVTKFVRTQDATSTFSCDASAHEARRRR